MGAWYAERASEVDRSCGQLGIASGLLAQGSSAVSASDGSHKLSAELRQLQASLVSGARAAHTFRPHFPLPKQ